MNMLLLFFFFFFFRKQTTNCILIVDIMSLNKYFHDIYLEKKKNFPTIYPLIGLYYSSTTVIGSS